MLLNQETIMAETNYLLLYRWLKIKSYRSWSMM